MTVEELAAALVTLAVLVAALLLVAGVDRLLHGPDHMSEESGGGVP